MNSKWLTTVFAAVLVAGLLLVAAPQSALAACSTGVCVRDDFSAQVFTGSSGAIAWGGNWIETGDGTPASAAGGNVLIQTSATPNYIEFNSGAGAGDGWARCVGMFPSDAQAGTVFLKAAIAAAVGDEGFNDDSADQVNVEYALSTTPTTGCGTAGTWTSAYSNNSDRTAWVAIGTTNPLGTGVVLPDSLRGQYFWIRIVVASGNAIDSGGDTEYQRLDYVEVSYQSPLAVDLAGFTASAAPEGVTLAWETVSETDNAGFNVYRADSDAGPWAQINAALIPAAAPGSSEGHAYIWTDATAAAGVAYWYQLEDVALDGATTLHPPVTVAAAAEPNALELASFGATILPRITRIMMVVGLAILALVALGGAARRRLNV